MGGYGYCVIVWFVFGIVYARHPHGPGWGVGRNSLRSSVVPSAAAASLAGGSAAASTGRRRSMSITLSAATDPFASPMRPMPVGSLRRVSGRRNPLSLGRGTPTRGPLISPRRSFSRAMRRPGQRGLLPGRRVASGRGPGYLVIPANAMIQFLASQSGNGATPPSTSGHVGGHVHGMQPGIGIPGLGIPGLTFGRLGQGGIQGLGQGLSLSGVAQPAPYSPLLNALGLRGNVGMIGSSPNLGHHTSGGPLLGGQIGLIANLLRGLRGTGSPITISDGATTISILGHQASVTTRPLSAANAPNNIIISDQLGPSGHPGSGLVIGGHGGSITIQGSLLSGGRPAIEAEELEPEEVHSRRANTNNQGVTISPVGQNSAAGSQSIVLDTAGGKSQTIMIGSSGGTFSIGDKTPGGVQIPGNATFILNSGTTPRVDV